MNNPICRDCKAENIPTRRPAPFPGPRCATHHRQTQQRRKQAAHARHVHNTYGLTPEQYQALYEAQGGTCAICQKATGKTRKLSVDHDHTCCPGPTSCGNCVRGLLCRPCNDLLGRAGDSPAMFHRAIHYLANPPAKRTQL